MCFAIPKKVAKVKGDTAWIENGNAVKIVDNLNIKPGQYLNVLGNIAIGKFSKTEGLKIRRLIRKLNIENE